jgi:hypothetical protein
VKQVGDPPVPLPKSEPVAAYVEKVYEPGDFSQLLPSE